MKCSDTGDFCVLYIEPEDDKSAVFELVSEQKKPVVILLSPPSGAQSKPRVFQRPEDFGDLKHLRRQRGLTLYFVITGNEYLRQLAARNGFATYVSIDALGEALEEGHSSLTRQRATAHHPRSPPCNDSPHPRCARNTCAGWPAMGATPTSSGCWSRYRLNREPRLRPRRSNARQPRRQSNTRQRRRQSSVRTPPAWSNAMRVACSRWARTRPWR